MTPWMLIVAISMTIDDRAASEVKTARFATFTECNKAGKLSKLEKQPGHKITWACLNLKGGKQ